MTTGSLPMPQNNRPSDLIHMCPHGKLKGLSKVFLNVDYGKESLRSDSIAQPNPRDPQAPTTGI